MNPEDAIDGTLCLIDRAGNLESHDGRILVTGSWVHIIIEGSWYSYPGSKVDEIVWDRFPRGAIR